MLKVEKLHKNYGTIEALKGIDISIDKGEVYGLLGPNGAGKSTAINIICGILSPTSGSITIDGLSIITDPSKAKRKLGVVLQEAVLVEELSAYQNCLFFGSLYDIPKALLTKRARELLSWIGLSDRSDEKVKNYSGGMKRRLSLVLSVLHQPEVLVLDEPTVGLDPQTRLLLLDSVSEIARKGTAVLFSTHYLEEAEKLCNRVGIIDNGKIIKEGTLDDLRKEIEDVQVITLRGIFDKKPVEDAINGISGGKILLEKEEEMVLSVPSSSENMNRVFESTAKLSSLNEISVKPPSLESLFISLTGRRIRE